MGSIAQTLVMIGIVYLLERKKLKQTNAMTRWAAVALLLISGLVWLALLQNINIPRPYNWLEAVLGNWVPVS
ncbi:hypothetical protein [Paenibacillus mesotrionivorans]|uniref:Uncharacterized protein n=1 Tax=Paenibacillus mesotrionivorans TaxID=3160968 RepID=A0ACC7NZ76_9BACL